MRASRGHCAKIELDQVEAEIYSVCGSHSVVHSAVQSVAHFVAPSDMGTSLQILPWGWQVVA